MGIFSKIKNAVSRSSDEQENPGLEAVRREMRTHTRYPIQFFNQASVNLDNGWIGSVMDISYGGIAVKFEAEKCDLSQTIPVLTNCSLAVLGRRHRFEMKTVRTVPNGNNQVYVGFCFNHSSPDTLMFLREVIEPMRHGRSLEELNREFRAEQYQTKDWQCFRGDGPVDLVFQLDVSGTKIEEALMTLKSGDHYHEVGFQKGKLWTGQSQDSGGAMSMGTRMIPSTKPEIAVLRRAFIILASAPVKSAQLIRPFVDIVNDEISAQEQQGVA